MMKHSAALVALAASLLVDQGCYKNSNLSPYEDRVLYNQIAEILETSGSSIDNSMICKSDRVEVLDVLQRHGLLNSSSYHRVVSKDVVSGNRLVTISVHMFEPEGTGNVMKAALLTFTYSNKCWELKQYELLP